MKRNRLLFLILILPIFGFGQYHLIKKDTISHPISKYYFEGSGAIMGHKNETIFGSEFGAKMSFQPVHLTAMYSTGKIYTIGIYWEFGHLFEKRKGYHR